MKTRRSFLQLAVSAAGTLPALASNMFGQTAVSATDKVVDARRIGAEGARQPDMGDGYFINPILPGDHPDPNVLKDGEDYYLSYSSFDYYPGVVIWHSRDLVNWTPIGPALQKNIGSVWALDLVKYEDRYFIYIPTFSVPSRVADNTNFGGAASPFKIYVIYAASMHGPWSEPIDMGIAGYIDPGHIVGADDKRYLFLNDGHRVPISADGLHAVAPVVKVYDGWEYPEDWSVEGFALEGPKLLRRNGWFYMFSGEGGTAGPPTSHMVVVARSRSIDGPWQNCPHNPIVHTGSPDERWMSRGHATPVQGPRGDWWLLYHGYENGFRTLGRQPLLEPFEWTADDWPVARGGNADQPMQKPLPLSTGEHGQTLSDTFQANHLGTKLAFFQPKSGYLERTSFGAQGLSLSAQGSTPGESSPLAMITGDHSYEVTIHLRVQGKAQGGLLLFYNKNLFVGLGSDGKSLRHYKLGQELTFGNAPASVKAEVWVRGRNVANVVTFSWSDDGVKWKKAKSYEVSGYNHNIGDGFLSLRPAIFACGEGQIIYQSLNYAALQT